MAGGAISSLLSDREIRLGRKKRTAINATAPAGRCVTEFFLPSFYCFFFVDRAWIPCRPMRFRWGCDSISNWRSNGRKKKRKFKVGVAPSSARFRN